MRSFSFPGSRGVFKMWRTRRSIASERGGIVVSSTSKSASALSRVEGVATGCSGSEKESEVSWRLAMFRERLCDDPEESSRATYDEVRARFSEGVAGSFNGRACRKPLPYSVGHNQRIFLHGCRKQLHRILHGGTNGFRQNIDVGIYRRRSRHAA